MDNMKPSLQKLREFEYTLYFLSSSAIIPLLCCSSGHIGFDLLDCLNFNKSFKNELDFKTAFKKIILYYET